MATHKVRPIKVKKMRVREIPLGEFFSMGGSKYIMVHPYDSNCEFASDALLIVKDECKPVLIEGDRIAFVRAVVTPRKK